MLSLNLKTWMAKLGQVAASVGTRDFPTILLELLASHIPHDYAMIVRYSRRIVPEIVFSQGIAAPVLKTYFHGNAYEHDPFLNYWRYGKGVRLLTFRDLAPEDIARYRRSFAQRAGIEDEVVLFLPEIGQSSLALCLERKEGRFSADEVELLNAMFPVLKGLYEAHLSRSFIKLEAGPSGSALVPLRPMLLTDGAGARVYANLAWTKAEQNFRELRSAKNELLPMAEVGAAIGPYVLVSDELDHAASPIPHGRVFYLVSPSDLVVSNDALRLLESLWRSLTPKERTVVQNLLNGAHTGQIAEILNVTKGTVKNHLLRIFRKTGAKSQKMLIVQFMPLRGRH